MSDGCPCKSRAVGNGDAPIIDDNFSTWTEDWNRDIGDNVARNVDFEREFPGVLELPGDRNRSELSHHDALGAFQSAEV